MYADTQQSDQVLLIDGQFVVMAVVGAFPRRAEPRQTLVVTPTENL